MRPDTNRDSCERSLLLSQLISPFMPAFLSCHYFLTRRAAALSETARLFSIVSNVHSPGEIIQVHANARNDYYVMKRMKVQCHRLYYHDSEGQYFVHSRM